MSKLEDLYQNYKLLSQNIIIKFTIWMSILQDVKILDKYVKIAIKTSKLQYKCQTYNINVKNTI